MKITLSQLHLYNDTPVLEEGNWKLLAPNKWGVKWKHLSESPIVVHMCPDDVRKGITTHGAQEIIVNADAMKHHPHCTMCKDPIPEGIQALWQLSNMEAMLQ